MSAQSLAQSWRPELRRLALVYDGIADGYSPAEAEVVRRTAYSGVAMKLRTRADELDST